MKITLPFIGFVLLMGFLISIVSWAWMVISQFSIPSPWWYSFPWNLWHTFDNPALRWIGVKSVVVGFIPPFALLWFLNEANGSDGTRVLRGARIVSGAELAGRTRLKPGKRSKGERVAREQVEIGGVPIPPTCEPNHFLLAGSTSTGKSTAVDELLCTALKRGDRCIVIDPNGHALARFGRKGDILLNPFDKRGPGWSIFNEFRKSYDYDRFAKSVIPDAADSSAQQWHGYAQQLFAEVARAMVQVGEMSNERLLYWLTHAPAKDLAAFLAGSAAAGLFEPGAEKALASTRFVLTSHVSALQYLHPGNFSLRSWLESGKGNLFITWREDMLTTLRPLVSAWADILIAAILTLPDQEPCPLWFILDELASLQKLASLEAGLTKGRKHGLRIVAGLQSVAQLDGLYREHSATTLRSCFRNLLALGCSNADPSTAEVISKGLGQTEIERAQTTQNNGKDGNTTSTTWQRDTQYAVLPAELMKLPPLHGFLKLAGDHPIAKIRLTPGEYPARVKPFVER